jgi:hypothetical protein
MLFSFFLLLEDDNGLMGFMDSATACGRTDGVTARDIPPQGIDPATERRMTQGERRVTTLTETKREKR